MEDKVTWIIYYDVQLKKYNSLGLNSKGYCSPRNLRPHTNDNVNLKDEIALFDVDFKNKECNIPIVIKDFDFGIILTENRRVFDEDVLLFLLENNKNIVQINNIDEIEKIDKLIKEKYIEYFDIDKYDYYSEGYFDSKKYNNALNEYKNKIGLI